ncbi:hypothetical protein BGL_2c02140 [Burkholderia plantarii]|uniref:Uncharacterized protein n=2 Tax=Burkholderia plantarii TaxID=41899 RepID=A0A0B6S4T7_BURPL|nr:hypothetical protein BGL_2c02140 [Burkholderia plantarii]
MSWRRFMAPPPACIAKVVGRTTRREYDVFHIGKAPQSDPADIACIREDANVSRSVSALHVDTPVSTVRRREPGDGTPGGIAARMPQPVRKNSLAICG